MEGFTLINLKGEGSVNAKGLMVPEGVVRTVMAL